MKDITAKAFAIDFPVCNEKQKEEMERAYSDAVTWSESDDVKQFEGVSRGCTCDLIVRLLQGKATRYDQVRLATEVAADAYEAKRLIASLSTLQDMLDSGVMPPPLDPNKKEWIN